MCDLIILSVHVITTVLRVGRPGGVRTVIAESVLTKHQLLILNRSRRRAPNLRILDRLIAGFCSLWIRPEKASSRCDRVPTLDISEFSSRPGSAKVPTAVLAKAANKARPQRPNGRLDPRCRGDEKAQSDLGMSPNRRADQFGFRNIY
jgi:hypothetical protein